MKKLILTILSIAALVQPISAQRVTDKLGRGLIAVPASEGGNLVSWRLLAEEYYDVTFNVYRDGTLIETGLQSSNFLDKSGKSSNQYAVSAVVRGVEQAKCAPVQAWSTSYKQITLTHEGIQSTLVPNDACCADVDGDGELEILMKFDNQSEIVQEFPKNGPVVNGVTTHEYSIFEVFKLDGTRLWWVNCGPNMGDFQNNEQNIVAYDWDGDGKAEAVMRAADGTTIHMADGSTYTVGNAGTNLRAATGGGTNWFLSPDVEYLVYMNGATGKPYQCINYPLLRMESGETDYVKAWDVYTGKYDGGHRASKFFFGAPYLDGRKPSIFLARGIYTRHKMIAYDVDPSTHTLTQRWRWDNNTKGSPWYGQGYHNYSIADVDEDGRDEIVFGSMVIDDNGKGLSTSGLGHGDAHHVGDLNPYAKGLEVFACNEDAQGFNYRDATTSKLYAATLHVGNDVGRSMAGNFTNSFPGGMGSAYGNPISTVTGKPVSGLTGEGVNANFRIYWDGDLCSETFNYVNGRNTEGCVAKYGSWSPIYTCTGSMTNNDTKGTPCYQGDIFGDWREEIIMRDGNNQIRIYSTPEVTTYRIPTLWSDHQYRNAMVWQMCGYNQPPHPSYFLGEMEGITMAPPPLTMNGRVEVANGGTIGTDLNDKHVIVCETNDTKITLDEGIQPFVLTFNVPSWVQGSAPSNTAASNPKITYQYYSCEVLAGSLAGSARLVKQGDGTLTLPATEFTHTGESHVWAGTLNFDGKMTKSNLCMDRFTTLNSNGGIFKSIKALYGSAICLGGENQIGTITADSTHFGFGSRLVVKISGTQCDCLKSRAISSERKTSDAWVKAGPEYLQPIIEVRGTELQAGDYVIAECSNMASSVTNFKVIGVEGYTTGLRYEEGKLILTLGSTRGADQVRWTGAVGKVWDYANTQNFAIQETGESSIFVNGDLVQFDDNATNFAISVNEEIKVDSMRFANDSRSYTLSGDGAIIQGAYAKYGKSTVTIQTMNSYTGGNYLRGGTTIVSALANSVDAKGNLGGVTTSSSKFVIENGAVLQTTAAVTNGSPISVRGELGGTINCPDKKDFTQQKSITGTLLTKNGAGCLKLGAANTTLSRLVVANGSVASQAGSPAATVELRNGTILYDDSQSTVHAIDVPKGASATWNLSYTNYTAYANKLTGAGTLTIIPRNTVQRVRLTGNWSEFTGTIKHTTTDKVLPLDASTGIPNGTLNIASGCTVTNVAKSFAIGKLLGTGTLGHPIANFQNQSAVSGSNTWKVGNSWESNGDFTFTGKMSDDGGSNKCNFEKIGSNTMTVSGQWSNSGTVKISSGILKLSGTATLGTGALTIAAGATMNGSSSGTLSNSSVTINGILHPGLVNPSGSFIFNNQNVTVGKTGELQFIVKTSSTSATMMSGTCIKNINKLTINGKIVLNIYSTYTPKAGDVFRLWTGVAQVSGTPTIEVNRMDLELDTSRLSEGVIVVKSITTALDKLPSTAEEETPQMYNLQGQPVKNPRAGLYISNGKKIIIK